MSTLLNDIESAKCSVCNFRAGEISKHKDGLERERDKLLNEVTQLTTKLNNAMGYQEELEKKNSEADLKINEIAGQLEVS